MNILIAEDEPNTLESYRIALVANNHNVVTSKDGAEALEVFLQHNDHCVMETKAFDLIILDYKMPKINGVDLARIILDENPNQMILFASAFMEDLVRRSTSSFVNPSKVDYLEKPFDIDLLLDKIDNAHIVEELYEFGIKINPKIVTDNILKVREIIAKLKNIETKYFMS